MRTLPDHFSIGQLARRTGVSAKTIRFYEQIGVLPAPARDANGYRRYAADDVNRLLLVRRLRLLRVPLDATRPLLADASDARCADVRRDLLALVDQRLHAIDHEIAALLAARDATRHYRAALARQCISELELFRTCDEVECLTAPEKCSEQEAKIMILVTTIQSCPDGCCCDECCEKGCCGTGCC